MKGEPCRTALVPVPVDRQFMPARQSIQKSDSSIKAADVANQIPAEQREVRLKGFRFPENLVSRKTGIGPWGKIRPGMKFSCRAQMGVGKEEETVPVQKGMMPGKRNPQRDDTECSVHPAVQTRMTPFPESGSAFLFSFQTQSSGESSLASASGSAEIFLIVTFAPSGRRTVSPTLAPRSASPNFVL